MKKFEIGEILMIKESFDLRKQNSNGNTDHIEKLNSIITKLRFPIKNLTSMQRAIINGCVKEFAIYPNQEILNKSDYELLVSKKEIEKDCLRIDIASKILNKIKKRTESKRRLFEDSFEKINKICNSKKVYYSITNDGKIFKIGIVTGKDEGLKTELGLTTTLSNFEIGFLSEKSFMKSSKPTELADYIKGYGKENKLTENQNRFIHIVKKASA